MLISVLNKFTNHWEIKNYNTMLDTEKWKADIIKAANSPALEIRKRVPREIENKYIEDLSPVLPPEWEKKRMQLKTDELEYEKLRAEGVPHLFNTAFLQASKTIPLYRITLDLLRSGQSPYEVIEWLTEQMHEKDKLISSYSKKDQHY